MRECVINAYFGQKVVYEEQNYQVSLHYVYEVVSSFLSQSCPNHNYTLY